MQIYYLTVRVMYMLILLNFAASGGFPEVMHRHQSNKGWFHIPMGPVLAAVLVVSFPLWANAAELVMYESGDCPWCETWHSEVGDLFDKTDEARVLTLRVIDVDNPIPSDLERVRGVVYTPTFVVLQDGREQGRILGYPGEDFFWGLLRSILGRIPGHEVAEGR